MNHTVFPSLLNFFEYMGTVVLLLLCMAGYFVYRRQLEGKLAKRLLQASDDRWRVTVEEAGSGAWDWDLTTNHMEFSNGWAALLGYDNSEIERTADAWRSLVHKDDLATTIENVDAHLAGKTANYSSEFRMRCKNGSYIWILSRGMVVGFSEKGMPTRMVGTHTDITSRKVADELMQLSSLVYQSSSEAMLVCNRDFEVLSVNPAFTELTGYTVEDVFGTRPVEYEWGPHPDDFYRALWASINEKGNWSGEIWSHRKNGEKYLQWATINTIRAADGAIERHVVIFSDITERKHSEDIIWTQANYDTLTGLPNRNRLQNIMADEIRRATDSCDEMAVMILDLDGFKEINDTLGHDRGDLLLQEAAVRLKSCLSSSDTIARMGGDEFIVLLPSIKNREYVDEVAANILKTLVKPFSLIGDIVYITASIGITFNPRDATEVDALLKNADQAMYAAKNAGRNRVAYFTPSMQEAAQNRMHLANDLRRALAANEFALVYQPIVELATNRIHKAEALIRWNHPKRGLVSPAEFIPVAEETGAIVHIGEWVFNEAAKQAALWRISHQSNFQISVNVSPAQFRDERSGSGIGQIILGSGGIVGESIVIEITEGLLLDASELVNDKLLGFRDAGIQVSLDDFGTGYSSLSYLQKFDIDYLKIDQSFVRNMITGSNDLALCEAIIVMAHKLGMKVIAEGVETVEQKELLLAAGCDYAQGYLFSRPVSPEVLEPLLSTGYVS